MKRILDLLRSSRNGKDKGDAVLVTVLLSIPLLAICFTFATGISMSIWQKTSYISAAQMAATDSLTAVQTNGYLGPQTIQKFTSEYLSQTRGITNSAVQSAGQGINAETAILDGGYCSTAVIDGVTRQLPYMEIQLDIARGTGESGISTYSYTSEGLGGTVVNPAGGHGTAVYGQQYRVINAKVWEASKNMSIMGVTTPIQGYDSACQAYNIDVSAILFGNNEDLNTGVTCFQPDAFPVTPNLVQQVATPAAQIKESPLPTCANAPVGNLSRYEIVTVTGTYRTWSQIQTPAGDRGWVLTSSLEAPSTWTVTYDMNCDVNGCSSTDIPNPTTYNWGNGSADIPLSNPTKDHYNYGGWQRYNCTTGANIGSASTTQKITFGLYGNLCYKATFTIHKIAVTFDAGTGATGGRVRTVYNWGTVVPVPNCAVKTGYDFKGWQNSAGVLIATSTGTPPACNVTGNVTVTGADLSETVYTAKWQNSTYTVSRTYGTGCSASGGQSTYIFSTGAQTVALGGRTNNGYENITWSKSSGPGSISGTNVSVPANGTGNIVVNATCSPITYSITVASNPSGGSNTGAVGTYNINGKSQNLAQPTMTGRTFSSWSIVGNSAGAGSSMSGNTLVIPAGAYGNITVQANMTANTYSISYNCNGRSNSATCGSGGPTSYTYGTAPNIPNASNSGNSFDGWTLTTNSRSNMRTGTSVIPAGTVGNVTIFAHWTWSTSTRSDYGATSNFSKSCTGSCVIYVSWSWSCPSGGSLSGQRITFSDSAGAWGSGDFSNLGFGPHTNVSQGNTRLISTNSLSRLQTSASGTCERTITSSNNI